MSCRSVALLALATAALAANGTCPVIFDGRVPATAALADFDTNNGGDWNPFNPDYIRAEAVPWSESLLLPAVDPSSPFDAETVPLEVTISDESIFQEQNGFRRNGLQFLEDTNEGSPANAGQVSLHFSLRLDAERPLNRSHEYLLVWHETAAYDANQFNFETGTIIGQEALGGDSYKLLDRNYALLWETPILEDEWQNFAITIDWDAE
ncbi:hypothetical protein IMZ48_28760 [Candidatus Bathyarchaeota archaeon]|nr:hypothetical protein [Candidatus Bathyarchaeota archaeon]